MNHDNPRFTLATLLLRLITPRAGVLAQDVVFTYEGSVTLLTGQNTAVPNIAIPDTEDGKPPPPWYKFRTPVTGTLSINTQTGSGTASNIQIDSFFGLLTGRNITLTAIGDGLGGNGSLYRLSMLLDAGVEPDDQPVHGILDFQGFNSAAPFGPSEVVAAPTGVASSTDAMFAAFIPLFLEGDPAFDGQDLYSLLLGPIPIATTTYDVMQDEFNGQLEDPQGLGPGLPITDDGLTGTPIKRIILGSDDNLSNAHGWSVNIDVIKLTVQSVNPPGYPEGDLNGDGKLDYGDLQLALAIVTGNHTATGEETDRGDIAPLQGGVPAPDGLVDLSDMLVLMRLLEGSVNW